MPPSITTLPLRPKPKPILKPPSLSNAFDTHFFADSSTDAATTTAAPMKTALTPDQQRQIDERLAPYLQDKDKAVRELDAAIVEMLRHRCRRVKYNTRYNVAAERYFVACHRLEWYKADMVPILEEVVREEPRGLRFWYGAALRARADDLLVLTTTSFCQKILELARESAGETRLPQGRSTSSLSCPSTPGASCTEHPQYHHQDANEKGGGVAKLVTLDQKNKLDSLPINCLCPDTTNGKRCRSISK